MFSYNHESNWNYAAPECEIEVQNPSQPIIQTCIAIIDSGADMTCIPESIVLGLGNLSKSIVNMRQPNGDIVEKDTFVINIRLGDYEFSNIEVIPVPRERGLIGRDIINDYKISLDAPCSIWGINCVESCTYSS